MVGDTLEINGRKKQPEANSSSPFPTGFPGTAAAIRCLCGFQEQPSWLLLPDDQMIERWERLTLYDGSLSTHEDVDEAVQVPLLHQEVNKAGEEGCPWP